MLLATASRRINRHIGIGEQPPHRLHRGRDHHNVAGRYAETVGISGKREAGVKAQNDHKPTIIGSPSRAKGWTMTAAPKTGGKAFPPRPCDNIGLPPTSP